ncbi:MAG: SpoIID/LytB domain-containing protein [Phormidesmis sp.]
MLKQPPSKPVLNHSSVPQPGEQPLEDQQRPPVTSHSESAIADSSKAAAHSIDGKSSKGTALLRLLASKAIALKTLGKQPDPKDHPLANTEADTQTSRKEKTSSARAKRLRTGGYVAIALGLLGSGTAFAFTQAPPELQAELQAAIVPERQLAIPPVSSPEDQEVQPFTSTRDLFLTNQIFYRKVEALAGATIVNGEPTSKSAGSTGEADKKAAEKSGTSKAKADKAAQVQAEKVTAIAPPAPAPEKTVFTGTTIDSVLEMRVAVAKDVGAIGFATSSSGTVTDLNGNVLKSLPAETASLASISNGLTIDGEPVAGGVFWIYPEDGGYVAVGDSWYRGRVLVALRDRGLIAVNYVFLGDYLYSVVGSEMSPDWSLESLKAQAVAARSYALTHNIHPASDAYFDLDNTPRFQAYKGIDREANTTQAAVQSTAGEFISHEGGIVESLYAASQDIVDDAHNGSGMSQLGARDLAEQGYSYAEILAHYYPGTALGRIETDAE